MSRTITYDWTIEITWPDGRTITKRGDVTTNTPYGPRNDFSGAVFQALTKGQPPGARITSFQATAR